MKTIISTLSCLLFSFSLLANTVVATSASSSPGDWDKPSTWSGGKVPQSGDLVLIPLQKAVNIKGTEYPTPPTLTIQVWGTMHFEPSGKLDLSAASSLQLFVGGKIEPRNRASSQLITMGGITKYNAANDGTVNGPAVADILSGASLAGQPMNGFGFGTPLAVYFKSISAQAINSGFLLRWETTGEQNVDHFEIERSENGSNGWLFAGTTLPKGTDASYTFTVAASINQRLFLRVKTVYTNSRYDYSSTVAAEKNLAAGLVISPNPTTDFVTVNIPSAAGTIRTIGLRNTAGIVVKTLAANGLPSSTRLSLVGMPRGTYFLFVETNNKERTTKTLVVQ